MASKSPEVGERAPDFSLPAAGGKEVSLADYRGKKTVVLYFYPKDETPGCTAESCAFRDLYSDFSDAGAEVIGVSSDSVASHESFAGHHRLPFVLLSDAGGRVQALYGVRGMFGLLPGRVTFVLDRHGIVRHRFSSQLRATAHVQEAMEVVRRLEAEAAGAS